MPEQNTYAELADALGEFVINEEDNHNFVPHEGDNVYYQARNDAKFRFLKTLLLITGGLFLILLALYFLLPNDDLDPSFSISSPTQSYGNSVSKVDELKVECSRKIDSLVTRIDDFLNK
jgi:hypothetical protein